MVTTAPLPVAAGVPDWTGRNYRLVAAVVKPVLRVWFRTQVDGAEHIPAEGGAILVVNHCSNADPPLAALATGRPVCFMSKAELFRGPFGSVLHAIGQFPVRRGGADREALEAAAGLIERGQLLGLFPEGTRGTGGFDVIHPGLAWIVLRTSAPVIPVALVGSDRVRRRLGWLPFVSPVRLVVGPPLGPPLGLPAPAAGRTARRVATEQLRETLQEFMAVARNGTGPWSGV
jgi:1-acyl-sn-glycerol-3-phosphate acyltransferase